MNNFEIKHKAYIDMQNIADFIATDNKIAAQDMVKAFYKGFELICSNPKIGRQLDGYHDHSVRYFILRKHYQVFYKVSDNKIIILRILTGYQELM